jgi:hypothetical protein
MLKIKIAEEYYEVMINPIFKDEKNINIIWCWRRMEKISWTDRVRNEEGLHSQGGEEYPTYNEKKKR